MSRTRRAYLAVERWLFAPIDARPVGLLRLLLGLTLVCVHLALYPELPHVLGQNATLFELNVQHPVIAFSLYDHFADADQIRVLHGVLTVPLVLFALGVGGRASNVAALAVLLSVHHGNPWAFNGGDRLLRLLTLYLLLVPNTRGLSVDAWWARRRGRPLPARLPVSAFRAIQLQMCWLYFHTGMMKAPGGAWPDGTATYYGLSVDVLQRFPTITYDLLGNMGVAWFTAVMTWVTLAWELGFFLLVLWKPTRWLALGIGLVVHSGVALTMLLAHFSAAAVVSYISFLDPAVLGARIGRVVGQSGGDADQAGAGGGAVGSDGG